VTSVLTRRRPPEPPAAPPARTPGSGSGTAPSPGPSPLVSGGTELALVAVTVAAAAGLGRLFADGAFAGPVLLAAVAAHALAWACRRTGLGLLASAGVSAAGLVLAVTWLVEPHTTTLLLPGSATWQAVVDDLREAWARFGDVKAPTPALRGFVLAAVIGVWTAASTSDFFAFRMRARFEAMAPAFTLFVFGAILGADRLRLPAAAAYLGAVVTFALFSEAARQSRASSWFAGRGRDGDLSLLRTGAALGVAAVVAAVVVGPHLPGAASAGLVSWRDGQEGGSRSRVTVSPLVDIRGRLVDQSSTELFKVQADRPSYWRLTSLDRFDGTIWSSLGTYQPTRATLPGAVAGRPLTQDFQIGALGSIWLPAAYRPDRVEGVRGARFDRDSGSLLAETDSVDGLAYRVVSMVPDLDAALLAGASPEVPDEIASDYLALPQGFSARIRDEAVRVTSGASSAYDRARRLQDYFRSGAFTYSLDVDPGHGMDAMERFLFVSQAGYCEQFAGTFAAMARAAGLPARVAVGFAPGSRGADGRHLVAGRDAHAWPEVYLGQYGWVAFEPTPGRAAPGASAYTGVPETAETGSPQGLATTTTSTTVAGGPVPDNPEEDQELQSQTAAPEQERRWGPLARALLAGVGLVAAYGLGVPAARRGLAARRRRRAATPSQQVLVAWQEAEDALGQAGRPRRPSETPGEFAARSAPGLGQAGTSLARLATDTTAAGFSATGVPASAVAPARQAAVAVADELKAQAGPLRRARWALDPRPLFRR
jgi:transglutaminase-like putative cysteine protease